MRILLCKTYTISPLPLLQNVLVAYTQVQRIQYHYCLHILQYHIIDRALHVA